MLSLLAGLFALLVAPSAYGVTLGIVEPDSDSFGFVRVILNDSVDTIQVDLHTGLLNGERWERWRRHDPIHLVEECTVSLRSLRLLYFDCGIRDQYHLHYGARLLHKRLEVAGIAHVFEEFEDNHSRVDYRMDFSLPRLWEAIQG